MVAKPSQRRAPRAKRGEWRPSRDVVAQRVKDGTILVHLESDRIYALNPTASRVWDLVTSGASRERIEERLRREFRVTPARLARDVARIIGAMAAKGLLERGAPRTT